MFSTDLSYTDLERIYGKINVPVAVFISAQDEYVPASVDKGQVERLFRNLACVDQVVLLDKADHAISGPEIARDFIAAAIRFVTQV
jgi:pimeloyl-ACP methyl ester carboxylesterase